MNTYEAMVLFDPTAGTDMGKLEEEVNRLMERCGAQTLMWGKWDERRLAYPIKRHKRAVYVLIYFKADADRITGLERDTQLSETILRCLVLRADHVSEEQMRESLGRAAQPASSEEDSGQEQRGEAEKADAGQENKDASPAPDASQAVAETSSPAETSEQDET